jgi:exodeoxyribonuclease VII large subunit
LPRRIGIVTSPSGSVIRDMLHILERRFPGLHIRVFPAQVQGDGSVEQICAGLDFFSKHAWAEVVILARGGGSLEDLWSFNEEAVARAIASSKVPVISAIGHETDFTIADFVADLRAPTPSAAAELAICTKDSLLEQIAACQAKAVQAMRYRLLIAARSLHQRGSERATTLMHRAIARRGQRLDDLSARLHRTDLRLRFAKNRHRRELLRERLLKSMQHRLWQARRRHESLADRLRQLSPLAVLERGYSIVENAAGQVLRSSTEAAPNEQLRIRLHQGEIEVQVI